MARNATHIPQMHLAFGYNMSEAGRQMRDATVRLSGHNVWLMREASHDAAEACEARGHHATARLHWQNAIAACRAIMAHYEEKIDVQGACTAERILTAYIDRAERCRAISEAA